RGAPRAAHPRAFFAGRARPRSIRRKRDDARGGRAARAAFRRHRRERGCHRNGDVASTCTRSASPRTVAPTMGSSRVAVGILSVVIVAFGAALFVKELSLLGVALGAMAIVATIAMYWIGQGGGGGIDGKAR